MFYIFLSYGFGYGLRPKFVRAEHSATAEGQNCAYGPTLHFWPTLLIAHPVKAVGAVSELNLAAAPASFIATLF